MTNKKIKNYQRNMQIQIALREAMKNLMILEIALVEAGESRAKVQRFDRTLDNSAAAFRKDVKDDVFDTTVDRFLLSVNLTYEQIYELTRGRCLENLKKANYNSVILATMERAIAEDFSGDLILISNHFGYGEKRIKRLLDFYKGYSGDPLAEAAEKFNYTFAAENEIKDYSQYRTKKKTENISIEETQRIQNNLEALRRFQEGKKGDTK